MVLFQAPRQFLERLRESDDTVKKRWIVFLTSVVMAFVVFVWLAYFNNLLQGFESAALPTVHDRTPGSASSGNNAGGGLASIPESLGRGIRNFMSFFGEPRTYRIEPSPEPRE